MKDWRVLAKKVMFKLTDENGEFKDPIELLKEVLLDAYDTDDVEDRARLFAYVENWKYCKHIFNENGFKDLWQEMNTIESDNADRELLPPSMQKLTGSERVAEVIKEKMSDNLDKGFISNFKMANDGK